MLGGWEGRGSGDIGILRDGGRIRATPAHHTLILIQLGSLPGQERSSVGFEI